LARDVPEHGLLADDRLEPSSGCPDVGAFESLSVPVDVVFWRRDDDSITRHRNPIFREHLGITAEVSMTIDTLHALYLGVMLVWCRTVVWALLSSGVYGATGSSSGGLTICCLAMRSSLFAWYKDRHRRFPSEVLTQVSDWTPSMVGTQTHPRCKTKAAETWSVLLWLLDELRRLGGSIGDWQRLLQAGSCMESLVVRWRGCPWKLSSVAIQEPSNKKKPSGEKHTHRHTHTAHYTLHTTHYLLHTTHYTLHTTHYTLHTTHYTPHTTHYTTVHYTTLHRTTPHHTTLHHTTPHYTTRHHTTHCTLHPHTHSRPTP
jgi:hypothetical protein